MNKSSLFSAFASRTQIAIIKPNNGSRDLVRSSHISPQTDEPCRYSCRSAGTDPLQRSCLVEEYVTHMTTLLVSHHMWPPLTCFLFSIAPSTEKGSLGNPCDPTQAVVYYCWFSQEPSKLLTPEIYNIIYITKNIRVLTSETWSDGSAC